MKPDPQVSVIIPTYNRRDLLPETIDSVLAQRDVAFEVIVVNDGSTDDTARIIQPYSDSGQIRYLEQQNAGQSKARNLGLANAKGEFVVFLDDDDLWPEDRLARHVKALEDDPDAAGVFGAVMSFSGSLPEGDASTPVAILRREDFVRGNRVNSPGASTLRKSAVDSINGFTLKTIGADDWDFWIRLTSQSYLRGVAGIGLFYRQHPQAISRNTEIMLRSSLEVLNRHFASRDKCTRREVTAYVMNYVGAKASDDAWASLFGGEVGSFFRKTMLISRLWIFSSMWLPVARTFLGGCVRSARRSR
jgi:glycosyltransferase involved in cell wall biosynthesis